MLTNQIITCAYSDQGENLGGDNTSVMPALGSSWAHFVNIRIILQFLDDERREVMRNEDLQFWKKYL